MLENYQKTIVDKNQEKKEETRPLLSDEEIQNKFLELLRFSKVIREPVHGDIWITETEREIIDIPLFQRLRKIKQLGPSDLIYPGAKHTRFEHSIGTLYMAQQIIDSIKKNEEMGFSKVPLAPEDIFITRIVALIHDMAHLSWGHTLENEGNLFGKNKQWLDNEREEKILNEVLPIIKKHLYQIEIPDDKIDTVLECIEKILLAEEEGEVKINELNRPYIADIVGNTICADLLDYLKRDAYYTGLKMTYDPRILSYFVIEKPVEEKKAKPRVAILLERRKGLVRDDIISYCVDLLRLRYSLAEKVYYHRVKTIFSAMIIKMIYCALEGEILTKEELLLWGDDALLYKILHHRQYLFSLSVDYKEHINDGPIDENLKKIFDINKQSLSRKAKVSQKDEKNWIILDNGKYYEIEDTGTGLNIYYKKNDNVYVQAANKLAENIMNRRVFRKIYSVKYEKEEMRNKLKVYTDPNERYQRERYFEELFKVPPGSVVIYSPKLDSGKAAETKMLRGVWETPYIRTLHELGGEPEYNSTIGEQMKTITTLYKSLWKFYVFLDAEYVPDEERRKCYEEICEQFFQNNQVGKEAVILRGELMGIDLTMTEINNLSHVLQKIKDPREIKKPGKYIDDLLRQTKGGADV